MHFDLYLHIRLINCIIKIDSFYYTGFYATNKLLREFEQLLQAVGCFMNADKKLYSLLVVDDEPGTRNTLCSCFPWEDIGFNIVFQANNGQEALDYIRQHPVDVVLCDIRMPVLSGIDLARELYLSKSPTKVVFLSGYRDFEYAKKALDFGVKVSGQFSWAMYTPSFSGSFDILDIISSHFGLRGRPRRLRHNPAILRPNLQYSSSKVGLRAICGLWFSCAGISPGPRTYRSFFASYMTYEVINSAVLNTSSQ